MSIIYLVRHGQSEANRLRIWGGDMPLSEKGREQALTVPGKIKIVPDKVVSSTLQRANMTARIAYPDAEVEKNKVFDEIWFGELDKQPMTEESIDYYHKNPEEFFETYKGDDLHERAEKVAEAIIGYAKEYEKVAIFTSDTLMRNIVTYIRGERPNDSRYYYIRNCEILVFEYDGKLKIIDDSSMEKLWD